MADIFLLQKGDVEDSRPLAVPGWPHDEFGGGRQNQKQKQVAAAF
jgi:alpha/beta superfamily hydrolase